MSLFWNEALRFVCIAVVRKWMRPDAQNIPVEYSGLSAELKVEIPYSSPMD